MKGHRRSTFITVILVAYLAVMAYIGRGELAVGRYLYYFGIIAVTLACITLLNIVMRRRENARRRK